MADFSNLGEHCSFQYCKQKDFLPFTCSACSQVYCKEHFRFDDHDCPNKGVADKQVILCPICNSSLKLMGNEDPNVVFQRHVDSGECARKVQSGGGKAKQAKCPVEVKILKKYADYYNQNISFKIHSCSKCFL